MTYGKAPIDLGPYAELDLREVMYYLYLPVIMPGTDVRLPRNLEGCRGIIYCALAHAHSTGIDLREHIVYISARKGWATPDNPLNRPGWHCDGFGTEDLNYVWWRGHGTRFLIGDCGHIPDDHKESMVQFSRIAADSPENGMTKIKADYPEAHLYALDPFVVHATPLIEHGSWRQYVKVSISRHRYNLENNSHNHLFAYSWPMFGREEVRNDTHRAQRDYA